MRLRRGDFDTAHRVAADPLETARSFEQAGAAWVHMVDLDGARTGSAQNQEIILRIARETSLLVEAGGGIRDMDTVAYYLQNGVSRVVLGSAALENPQLVKKAVEQYGSRVAVGIVQKRHGQRPGLAVRFPDGLSVPGRKNGSGWIWLDRFYRHL